MSILSALAPFEPRDYRVIFVIQKYMHRQKLNPLSGCISFMSSSVDLNYPSVPVLTGLTYAACFFKAFFIAKNPQTATATTATQSTTMSATSHNSIL